MIVVSEVERSVNVVIEPRQAVSAEKSATGVAFMVTSFTTVSEQLLTFVTVMVTV